MKTYIISQIEKNVTKQVTQSTRPNRKGWVVVDSWPANDQPPTASSITAWQAWGNRTGHQI